MNKRVLTTAVLMGVALAASGTWAADYNCPSKIETDQRAKNIPAGWQLFVDTVNETHSFERVRFYDGAPQEMADLKPDNGDSNQPPVWTFGPRQGGRSIWEVCVYGDTSVMLSKKIPDTIKTCRAKSADGSPSVKSVSCE